MFFDHCCVVATWYLVPELFTSISGNKQHVQEDLGVRDASKVSWNRMNNIIQNSELYIELNIVSLPIYGHEIAILQYNLFLYFRHNPTEFGDTFFPVNEHRISSIFSWISSYLTQKKLSQWNNSSSSNIDHQMVFSAHNII